MGAVILRKASPDDSAWAGERLLETLYGFGIYLMGLGDRDRASRALSTYFRLRANRFSHQYSYIAQVEGDPAGLLLVFPGSRLLWATLAAAFQIFSVYSLGEVVDYVKRMIRLRDEEEVDRDEFYIAHLGVSRKYQRQGIGYRLLKYAQELAIEGEMNKLALMAEMENKGAIAIYKRFGFIVTKEYFHPHQLTMTGSDGYVKMVKML